MCHKVLFYLMIVFIVFALTSIDTQSIAKNITIITWHQLIEYEPTENKIEGIPIEELDKDWTKVFMLTKKNFLSDSHIVKMFDVEKDIKYMDGHGYDFSKKGDFNGDGYLEKIVIGVYQDKSGQQGRFFLVLTKNNEEYWSKAFLVKVPGKAGFSVLSGENNSVDWSFSIGRDDDYYTLAWSNGRYELSHFPKPEHGMEYFLCSAKYKPTEKTIEGVSIGQIDESWFRVLVLTKDNFMGNWKLDKMPIGKEERREAGHLEEYGYDFSREGDFNNDGIKDKALVGVYQDKLGKIGNFFLVLTEDNSNKWRKDFLVKIPSEKLSETRFCLFSVLTGKKYNIVQWSTCINCDAYYILTWDNGKYGLEYSGDSLPKEYKTGRD